MTEWEGWVLDELRGVRKELEHIRSLTLVKQVPKPKPKYKMPASVLRIMQEVEADTGVTVAEMLSNRRHKELIAARETAMVRARMETGLSFPDLGKAFNRHHTTVLDAVKRRG